MHHTISRAVPLLAVGLALILAACAGGSGTASQARIAFVSERDGNPEIYVINGDGSGLRRLTDSPAIEEFPLWSPSGEQISFMRRLDGGGLEYAAIDPDGSDALTHGVSDQLYAPPNRSWSPDSTQIALRLRQDGTTGVFVASSDGASLTELSSEAELMIPTWAPGDDRVLIQSGLAPSPRLYTIQPDGSGRMDLAGDGTLAAWSPDGTRIAFVAFRDGNEEVYVMNSDGSEQVNVSQNPGEDGPPAGAVWSPDGTQFAFYSVREEAGTLFVTNADGSARTAISTNLDSRAFIEQIFWSPDGTRIAFTASVVGVSPAEIFVINAGGGGLNNVTDTPAQLERIIGWSSDSERIFFIGDAEPVAVREEANVDIFAVDADGTNLTTLVDALGNDYDAVLFPGE